MTVATAALVIPAPSGYVCLKVQFPDASQVKWELQVLQNYVILDLGYLFKLLPWHTICTLDSKWLMSTSKTEILIIVTEQQAFLLK